MWLSKNLIINLKYLLELPFIYIIGHLKIL